MSTGSTTPEGLARAVAAMVDGRRRWLAQLKAEGKKAPCGRKKGGRNRPVQEREDAAYVRQRQREWRQLELKLRAECQARRAELRKEREEARRKTEDHARRKARWEAGGPYWTEEEWEKM